MIRYNEIIERVTVTPELFERVLANAAEAAAKPNRRRSAWKPLALAAACLALVLISSLTLPGLFKKYASGTASETLPTADLIQGGWDAVEYDSAEALSNAAGFAIPEIPALREDASETSYILISGHLAQITYIVGDVTYTYRVSPGSEDNSGDYNEYDTVQTNSYGSRSVIYKGYTAVCSLALWETGGLSYSLAADPGIPFADMEALLRTAPGVR